MLLNVVCSLSLGVCEWIVSLCSGCVGCCAFCLICDARSCKCWCIGSTLVSSCRCCVLVSCVHPVAILRAVFCTICSLSMFVSDALGDHMVEAYSSTGLVMALYVSNPLAKLSSMLAVALCSLLSHALHRITLGGKSAGFTLCKKQFFDSSLPSAGF